MNIIVTVDKNWGIGKDNGLLFNLKENNNLFKNLTENKVVVMGRNSLEKIYNNKPLKKRINVCLSYDEKFKKEGFLTFSNFTDLFEKLAFFESDNIFVIGGEETYKNLLPYCKNAYVTKVQESKEADAFFTNLDKDRNWQLIKTSDPVYEDFTIYYTCKYQNKNVKKYNYGYLKDDLF